MSVAPTPSVTSQAQPASPPMPPDTEARLRQAAVDLEASFLAEMLKQAKFGEARGAFGGGAGEEQFASFLRLEHARQMAASGGIGLAENLFRSLAARHQGGASS